MGRGVEGQALLCDADLCKGHGIDMMAIGDSIGDKLADATEIKEGLAEYRPFYPPSTDDWAILDAVHLHVHC